MAAVQAHDDVEDDDLDIEGLRPGRHLELSSLFAMEDKYGEENVHDNRTYETSDGRKIRPDVVVTDEFNDPVEVREAKDVAELRESHVEQAAGYDENVVPREGTTIDVAEDTVVPPDVRDFADFLGIAISRRRKV